MAGSEGIWLWVLVVLIVVITGYFYLKDHPLNITGRTNLGQAFSPWFESGDIVQNICIEGGGTWRVESDFVGCFGFGTGTLNCNSITSLADQCRSYGAVWVCNEQNLYCKY